MLDTKKLIASFLVLAVFTIIGVFVFSKISGVGKNQLALQNQSSGENSVSITTKSAFLPEEKLSQGPGGGIPSQTSNLTQNLTQNLGLAFSLYNQADLNSPDASGLLPSTGLAVTESLLSIEPPIKDNGLWPPVKNSELVELKTYTADDNFKYAESFTSIMERTLSGPQFLGLFDRRIDMQTVAATIFTFNRALTELKKVPTPTPLFAFHKSFVQYLQDEKNTFEAATNFDDPIKALVILNGEKQVQARIGRDIIAFVFEYSRLDAKKLLSKSHSEYFGFLKPLEWFLKTPRAFAFNFPSIPAMSKLNETLSDVCDPEKLKNQENFAQRFKDLFTKYKDLFKKFESGDFTGGQDIFGINDLLSKIPGLGDTINSAASILAVPVTSVGPNDLKIVANTQITAEKAAEIADYTALVAKYSGDLLTLEIYRCNRMINTEVMKNELNKAMQDQTTKWVQNGGNPRFITNYNDYYKDAFLQGAQTAIKKEKPNLCPSYADTITKLVDPGTPGSPTGIFTSGDTFVGGGSLSGLTGIFSGGGLGGIFSGGGLGGISGGGGLGSWGNFGIGNILSGTGSGSGGCQIESIGVENFYNDFNAGGMDGYLSILLDPHSNFLFDLMRTSDEVVKGGTEAAAAAQSESVANQGYRADSICIENGNDGTCLKKQIVTPGQTISKMVDAGTSARYNQILNAQDFVKLAEGLASSLGTNLIGQSQSGLYGLSLPGVGSCISLSQSGSFSFNAQGCASLVSGALSGLLSGSGGGGGTPTSTATSTTPGTGTAVTCAPASQTILIGDPADFTAANGNGTYSWIAPGGSPLTGNGSSFSTTYSLIGNKTVTVVSNGQSATCRVRVTL